MKKLDHIKRGSYYFKDPSSARKEIIAFAGTVKNASVMIYDNQYCDAFLYLRLKNRAGMKREDAELFCDKLELDFDETFVPGYVFKPFDFNDFPCGRKFLYRDKYYPKDYDDLAVRLTRIFGSLKKASLMVFDGQRHCTYIYNMFFDKAGFTMADVEAIAKALDASVNELFEDAEASAKRWGGQVRRKIVK